MGNASKVQRLCSLAFLPAVTADAVGEPEDRVGERARKRADEGTKQGTVHHVDNVTQYNDFGVMICFCGMFVGIFDLGSSVGMCVGTMFFCGNYIFTYFCKLKCSRGSGLRPLTL